MNDLLNENNNLISVIVPVYNVSKHLNTCIKSLVEQTYTNSEIILINDGSTDDSLSICKAWQEKDNRIKIIDNTNRGSSFARNAGIEKSNGQYITFVDSDDSVSETYLETLLVNLEKYDADIAICGYKKNGQNCLSDSKYQMKLFEKPEIGKALIKDRSLGVIVWGKLFRRKVIGETRFLEGRINEDDLFCHQIFAKCNSIVKINEPLYFYTLNTSGITYGKFSEKAFDIMPISFERLLVIEDVWPNYLADAMYIAGCSFINIHIEYAMRKLDRDIAFQNKLFSDRENLYVFLKSHYDVLDKEIQFKVEYYYHHPGKVLLRDRIEYIRNNLFTILRKMRANLHG